MAHTLPLNALIADGHRGNLIMRLWRRQPQYQLIPQKRLWPPRERLFVRYMTGFAIMYLLAILWLSLFARRDPTSIFFSEAAGYQPRYSEIRRQQADTFIRNVLDDPPDSNPKFSTAGENNTLCLGIATVARGGVRYFRTTVGSVLEGLDPSERRRIFLLLFIAHTDPTVHPAYSEKWTHELADQVLLYNVSNDQLERLRTLEKVKDNNYFEKPLFDYAYLLKACLETGTSHIAILEDDVVAMDGWFHRTEQAVDMIESKMSDVNEDNGYLYLRLFYTERFFGWNSEEWPTYLTRSFALFCMITSALLLFRYRIPITKPYLTPGILLVTTCVFIPLTILIFFAAGRVYLFPLTPGVVTMNNFGCCSQGLLFSQNMAETMARWYEFKKEGFVDMLTEQYGNQFGNPRFAITPSVLQHVGRKTSKDDGNVKLESGKRSGPENIWSFGFEEYDVEELRRQHKAALRWGSE